MTFERTELSSGIRVLSARMPGQRAVAIGAWLGTGARDEPMGAEGVTHFLEHLVFKGTETRTALDIAETFDAIGGDLNAFTTKELTCFHARTLAGDLPVAVETIADIMRRAALTSADIESERKVVLEEISMHEDTPDDIVFDMFQESVWPEHPLGRRVQGVPDTIASLPPQTIRDYYGSHYSRDALVVAAAGDVEHERLLDLVEKSFGDDPVSRDGRAPQQVPFMPHAVRFEDRDIEQAHLVYGGLGISRTDDRRWALRVLNSIVGDGLASRLFQEIRERRGLAYAISSGHQAFADTGLFTVYAGCSPENAPEVLRIVRDTAAEIAEHGVTEAEQRRAIGHLRGSLLLSLDDPGALMSHLAKSELLDGEIRSPDEMIARIEGVRMADLHSVARAVLDAGRWSLTVIAPEVPPELEAVVREPR